MAKRVMCCSLLSLCLMLTFATTALAHGPFDGGGGFILSGSLIDWSQLEGRFGDTLDITGDFDFNDRETYLQYGGGGFGGSDFRIGAFGLGSKWTYPTTGESPFDRVMIGFDIHGLWMEQFISEFDRGGLSIGATLGMADLQLDLIQDFTGTFDEFIVEPPLKFAMKRTYWYIQPFVSTEVQIFDFMALKMTGTYFQGISFGEWELLDGQEVAEGPMDSIGFPSLQIMLLFGG